MLATLALLIITVPGLHAQSNTEYNFRQQIVDDGARFSVEDDAPILSMDCLAANGYGQWTLSATSGTGFTPPMGSPLPSNFFPGWYLLGNGLYTPSTRLDPSNTTLHPGCIPPGVVQNGSLVTASTPSEPKVTANLDGSVNYMWPDQMNRFTFDVNTFGPSDIDISLGFLANPAPPMHIIPSTIHSNPTPTATSLGNHDVVTEADFRDEFDVASDAAFVYIVWASTVNPVNAGQKEIWVTAIPLGTSTPAAGFPKFVGDGKFPTIACDPRNNRGASTPIPVFDVAYLTGTPATIVSKSFSVVFQTNTLTGSFIDPNSGLATVFTNPSHVRALVSSVVGSATIHAVYAIVQFAGLSAPIGSTHLVEYNNIIMGGTTPPANYVDGYLLTPASPIPPSAAGFAPEVMDAPIIAFANPYDNQTGNFDQFHCLYQLAVQPPGSPLPAPVHPLCIAEGDDNGAAFAGTPDTRLCMNQSGGILLPDIINTRYVGAVNQMGIHVHWHAADPVSGNPTHYYSRDMNRTFDEDIGVASIL